MKCIHSLLSLPCHSSKEEVRSVYVFVMKSLASRGEERRVRSFARLLDAGYRCFESGKHRDCLSKRKKKKNKKEIQIGEGIPVSSGDVTLDEEGIPTHIFERGKKGERGFYFRLHLEDASSFPLSGREYSSRERLYEEWKDDIGWKLRRKKCAWTRREKGGSIRIDALVVNEEIHPRWGKFFCPPLEESKEGVEWVSDLPSFPVPVFLCWEGKRVKYCGHWSFERMDKGRKFFFVNPSCSIKHRYFYWATCS